MSSARDVAAVLAVALAAVLAGACSATGSSSESTGTSASAPVGPSAAPSASVGPSAAPSASVGPSAAPSASVGPAPSVGRSDRIVGLADDGSTQKLGVGDRFLLRLGSELEWTVEIADPSVVSRVPGIAVVSGAQGVYEGRSAGRTTLQATGDPPCRRSTPACAAPSRLFSITVEVG